MFIYLLNFKKLGKLQLMCRGNDSLLMWWQSQQRFYFDRTMHSHISIATFHGGLEQEEKKAMYNFYVEIVDKNWDVGKHILSHSDSGISFRFNTFGQDCHRGPGDISFHLHCNRWSLKNELWENTKLPCSFIHTLGNAFCFSPPPAPEW